MHGEDPFADVLFLNDPAWRFIQNQFAVLRLVFFERGTLRRWPLVLPGLINPRRRSGDLFSTSRTEFRSGRELGIALGTR